MSSQDGGSVIIPAMWSRRHFLLEWLTSHVLTGLFFAALIVLFQDSPLLILALGGLPLGLSQRLILGRYVAQDTTEYWTLSTAAAWFGAMCFFVVYTFAVEAGSGIN